MGLLVIIQFVLLGLQTGAVVAYSKTGSDLWYYTSQVLFGSVIFMVVLIISLSMGG